MNHFVNLLCLFLITLIIVADVPANERRLNPKVTVEEDVYTFKPADNGSGPMWCRGNTCIVRIGDRLFASGLETLVNAKPLNNCTPLLFTRGEGGWELLFRGSDRTREPCPLITFHHGQLFLSHNPTITEPDAYNGPSKPVVLEFDPDSVGQSPRCHLPVWDGSPAFSEHSYRTFVADGERSEIFLMQNIGYEHAEWSFRDAQGNWSAQGKLYWPLEKNYHTPQAVRLCYPVVTLKNRKVFFAGVRDIIEPNPEWREYKRQLTGQEWDYDFRRLFFTWSDDITTGTFHDWIEIASREKTCGWITPWDLYVAPNDDVYLLWNERSLDERLREKFFPNEKQRYALEMVIIRNGEIIKRQAIVEGGEGLEDRYPGGARFHLAEDQQLFVFYHVSGREDGKTYSSNYITEVYPDGTPGTTCKVEFKIPFTNFFTATIRAGNKPSNIIDIFGQHENIMRYGSVMVY